MKTSNIKFFLHNMGYPYIYEPTSDTQKKKKKLQVGKVVGLRRLQRKGEELEKTVERRGEPQAKDDRFEASCAPCITPTYPVENLRLD